MTSLSAALVTVALGLFLLSFLRRVTASLATRRLFLFGVVDLDFPSLSLGIFLKKYFILVLERTF